ncbi:MAG: NotI family restriction endonuclease [Albidovulum sp.]|nr:NotI family restriction endonuclease [Albidovulum sp.]
MNEIASVTGSSRGTVHGGSVSAKRLMPQLQIKVPTLRRWGSKIAVAVDRPFFEAIGGPSPDPRQDFSDGDVIWMVPELVRQTNGEFALERGHWEVLTLENSEQKLLAAKSIREEDFEDMLREKREPI